jgi:ubiquinone/menaquinone biosynthesis C-methylase UbiE
MNINELLTLIRCPECSGERLIAGEDNKLHCQNCNATFEVVQGVPVLLAQNNLNKQEKAQQVVFRRLYSRFSDSDYKLENWRESMLNRVFNNVRKEQITNYLDIGCGATGYTVIEAAKRNRWTAVGMDISVEAMVKAKTLADKMGVGEKTAFIVGSAENVPLKSAGFNYVSLISVLEHLENDQTVVHEASRLLAEKGQAYICVPNAYSKIWPFLWPFYFYFDKKIGHLRHYSQQSLDSLMTRENLFQRRSLFYNGHLIKFFQILMEKLGSIRDEAWWRLEDRDINTNSSGVQLNAIYQKTDRLVPQ